MGKSWLVRFLNSINVGDLFVVVDGDNFGFRTSDREWVIPYKHLYELGRQYDKLFILIGCSSNLFRRVRVDSYTAESAMEMNWHSKWCIYRDPVSIASQGVKRDRHRRSESIHFDVDLNYFRCVKSGVVKNEDFYVNEAISFYKHISANRIRPYSMKTIIAFLKPMVKIYTEEVLKY